MNDLKLLTRRRSRSSSPLSSFQHFVLRFAGWYNLVAGACMIAAYERFFLWTGIESPAFAMPIQLVGVLVAIFGIGYLMTDRNPIDNRNVLFLGFLSKLIGPAVSLIYVANGMLPPGFLAVLFFCDTIYLWPFWNIYRRLEIEHLSAQSHPDKSTTAFPGKRAA
ncbi:MAG: hypothetical protein AAF456_12280 [Planctomycetota bacterium]